jgi:hypothetical protein
MSFHIKATTVALIATVFSSMGGFAGAAPISASLALRDAVAPVSQIVQWGGDPYYGYNYGYYCPPYFRYYSSAYGYASPYYGGYGYRPYYRPYGYSPRAFGSYWLGY